MTSGHEQATGAGPLLLPAHGGGAGSGRRSTRQGSAVLAALAATGAFRSAQDLHAELRRQGHRIGLSTVYRHLQAFADLGQVDAARTSDGEAVYRRCATEVHHHHLVCRHCGHTVEVSVHQMEAEMQHVAAAEGFTDIAHTVEFFGSCAACSAAASPGRLPSPELGQR